MHGLHAGHGEAWPESTAFGDDADGASGVIKAVEAMWPNIKRVRCWFHKMQNLQGEFPPAAWPEFKALVQDVRDAASLDEGRRRLEAIVERYGREFPEGLPLPSGRC